MNISLATVLEAICALHESMFHFKNPTASAYYSRRSREFLKCLEPVWRNLWMSRDLLVSTDLALDTIRWYLGARLLHLWAILCNTL